MLKIFKAKDKQVPLPVSMDLQLFTCKDNIEFGKNISEGFRKGIEKAPAPPDDAFDAMTYSIEREHLISVRKENIKLIEEMEQIKRERDLWKRIAELFYDETLKTDNKDK